MKVARPKTAKYHNIEDGDTGRPERNHFKKRFWKRFDRKRFFKALFKQITDHDN